MAVSPRSESILATALGDQGAAREICDQADGGYDASAVQTYTDNWDIPGQIDRTIDAQAGGQYLSSDIVGLTAATGSASDTINDVGTSFNQTTLNNNFKSLAAKLNTVITHINEVKNTQNGTFEDARNARRLCYGILTDLESHGLVVLN